MKGTEGYGVLLKDTAEVLGSSCFSLTAVKVVNWTKFFTTTKLHHPKGPNFYSHTQAKINHKGN